MANDSLISLHTALIDARKGYEEAKTDAEKPDMKSFFQKMIALHERSHQGVHKVLTSRGETPEEDGSFMSAVHKTVISVRSAVAGLDRNSLSSFASGEERIVKYYDEAIEDNAGDAPVVKMLGRQRDELADMIGHMKRLAA